MTKRWIGITTIKLVGNYAVQLVFDDGHDIGLYSWRYLYELCHGHDAKWQTSLDRLTRPGQVATLTCKS